MKTVVEVERSDEGKFEETGLEKSNLVLSSPKHVADPVVYKLVRVEGDGRLVAATDDELMEVEGLLENEKHETHIVANTGQALGCTPNEASSFGMPQLESLEGLSQFENTEANASKLSARLEKFHPSGIGMTATFVRKGLDVPSFQMDNGSVKVLEAKLTPEQTPQQFVAESKKEKPSVELGQNMGLKYVDPSGDASDDNVAAMPMAKGGTRRKYHRGWTLSEVMKLVEDVSKYGAGRWSEIKRLAFASYSYRTSVDLKDKWRNLLKASFAQTPADKGVNSRKHPLMPIPAPILLCVRELAEMQAQVPPPNLSASKLAACGGRSVNETRPGFL